MIRAALIILMGLLVDGVQAFISLGLFVLFNTIAVGATPTGIGIGAAAGCVVGGILGAIGGFFAGGVGAIPGAGVGCIAGGGTGAATGGFVGGAVAAAAVPLSVVSGFAVSVCVSASLGAFFITVLVFNGMFYPKYLLPGGITELIPGIDMIPAWTTIAILSVIEKNKEQKGGVVSGVGAVANAIKSPSPSSIGKAAQSVKNISTIPQTEGEGSASQKEPRVKNTMNDVTFRSSPASRPTKDNAGTPSQKYAA